MFFKKWIIDILQNFLSKRSVSIRPPVVPVNIIDSKPIPEPIQLVAPTPDVIEANPVDKRFLVCPIKAKGDDGTFVTSRSAKITAVIDHMGTSIDSSSKNTWGLNAKDKKTKAFNGEVGDGDSSAEKPYGYAKKDPAPFFSEKEINYVGAPSANDKYGPTFYLNYDGHAGYDFKASEGTELIAPADGYLYKGQVDPIDGVNKNWALKNLGVSSPTAWEGWHTFFIKHPNGYSTWFLHCKNLVDEIENQLITDYQKCVFVKEGQTIAYSGKYGGVPPHLHFEVRNEQGGVVDPYKDNLWKDY